jgi:hypothetical protein
MVIKNIRRLVVVCLGLISLQGVAPASARETLVLAKQSKALYKIVHVGLTSQVEKLALNDLVFYLNKISGAEFAVAAEKQGSSIFVGKSTEFFFEKGFSHLQARDSFSINTKLNADGSRDIFLVGFDSTATAFAVYTFLEDLGCRWFMPGKIGEVIPKTDVLEWPVHQRTEQPDFDFRQIWWAYGGPAETAQLFNEWKLRNKVVYPTVNHGHNLTNSLPPETHFKTHPEYYALVNGVRRTTQICTSNPEVIQLVIDRINDYFDKNPSVLAYSLCPDDNMDFCECEQCQALDVGGMDIYNSEKPVITDRYIQFLNAVARGIQEKHPEKNVSTYAYQNYSTPPIREKIDSNVVIVFTTSVYCAAHGIGDLHCDSRQQMKQDLAGWTKAASEVYIYEYDPVPFNAELPWPVFGARCREMPEYLAMGIRGFSFECHNSWATLAPNFYVSAKMMWDANQDAETILNDFYQKYFGKAGDSMAQFYNSLEKILSLYQKNVEWGQHDFLTIFTPQKLSTCRKAIEAAKKIKSSEIYKERIWAVDLGFEYLENYIELRNSVSQKLSYEKYKQKRGRCEEIIDKLYEKNKDYVLRDVAYEYLRKGLGEIASNQYKDDLGLVANWKVIGPFDNTGNQGHERIFPPENELVFDKNYPGLNGDSVSWQSLENPPWLGKIDFVHFYKESGYACAYAAAFVHSPKKQKVQIRLGSNDSVKMWLNKKLMWDNKIGRGVALDDDIVEVTLPKGESAILLKICNQGSNWGFCFRITDENGDKISGLNFSLE